MVGDLLQRCLFFTANSLARVMTSLANDEFKSTGLSPHYAFIVMLICEKPGITQKEICEYLQLTPSTITRFVDKLEGKHLVKRTVDGKNVLLEPTTEGQALLSGIQAAWERLCDRYTKVLGHEERSKLISLIGNAIEKLESK